MHFDLFFVELVVAAIYLYLKEQSAQANDFFFAMLKKFQSYVTLQFLYNSIRCPKKVYTCILWSA